MPLNEAYLGALGAFALSREKVPGTAETVAKKYFPYSEYKMSLKPTHIDRKSSIAFPARMPDLPGKLLPQAKVTGEMYTVTMGSMLFHALGGISSKGTAKAAGGSTTLTAAASRGALSIAVVAALNFEVGDYMQIGTWNADPIISKSEIRKISAINGLSITFEYGLDNAYAIGATVVELDTAKAFTHLIFLREDGFLPQFTAFGNRVADKGRQSGCEILKIGMDCAAGSFAKHDIESYGLTHEDGYAGVMTPVMPAANDILTFVGASVSIGGTQQSTIENFSFDLDNNLESRYALNNTAPDSLITRYPAVVERKQQPEITGKLVYIDYPTAEIEKMTLASQFELIANFYGALIEGTTYRQVSFPYTIASTTMDLTPRLSRTAYQLTVLTGRLLMLLGSISLPK